MKRSRSFLTQAPSLTDGGAVALGSALGKSMTMTTMGLQEEETITGAGIAALVAAVVRLPRKVTIKVPSFAQNTMVVAQIHAAHFRRMMALLSALVPGKRDTVATAARRFVQSDGDNAIGHRTTRFLLNDEEES